MEDKNISSDIKKNIKKITKRVKRIMTPAIEGMTVKQERACLSDIRSNAGDITADYVLENGWTAGDFSLKYIMGHQNKRKSKHKSNDTIKKTSSTVDHDHSV